MRLLLVIGLLAPAPDAEPVGARDGSRPSAASVASAIEDTVRLVDAGDLDAALRTVRSARAAADDPRLLYMEAQILRLGGACEEAVPLYQEFLTLDASDVDRRYAQAALDECGGPPVAGPSQAATPAPDPTQDTTPKSDAGPIDVGPPEPTTAPPPRVDRGVATSAALWGTAGVGIAAGAGLLIGAASVRAAAVDGRLGFERYQRREQLSMNLGAAGVVVLSVGAAVLSAAVTHALVRRRRAQRAH